MSDVASALSGLFSFEELLTPQFLCPVCGVIICAIVVFCIGVGFKSSSEPKFENAGEGDGVPFIKKKKKNKTSASVVPAPVPKKVTASPTAKVPKKRQDTFPEKSSAAFKLDIKQNDTYEPVTVISQDDWITPVTRKEKKARRRHEVTPDKETETLLHPNPVSEVMLSPKAASPSVEQPKQDEQTKVMAEPETSPSVSTERKGRTGKSETLPNSTASSPVVKSVEKLPAEKEESTKAKKVSKQKHKAQVEVPEKSETPAPAPAPAPITASPKASTRSKKKKNGGGAEASTTGGFPLAEFEVPIPVVVPAPVRKTPSPPSTDSSFELVDADAVREAFEAEHHEPSKTSGASRKKTKKPAKGSVPDKVEEEALPATKGPKAAAVVDSKKEDQPAASSNINFDELGGSIDDWQDAKPSRKRRRARRDD